MARITSIKQLRTVCDDLYNLFVDHMEKLSCNSYKPKIVKYNNGSIGYYADGNDCLFIETNGTIELSKEYIEIRNDGIESHYIVQYRNKNGHSTADLKKRAILLELKTKLEELFKDYL